MTIVDNFTWSSWEARILRAEGIASRQTLRQAESAIEKKRKSTFCTMHTDQKRARTKPSDEGEDSGSSAVQKKHSNRYAQRFAYSQAITNIIQPVETPS